MKTEVVFILDRSGSMSGLEKDTIGGFNSMIAQQKEGVGEATVTTILFDHEIKILHNRQLIQDVATLTAEQYTTRGSTALLDAIGYSVQLTEKAQQQLPLGERAQNIIFIITTDGEENSSSQHSVESIRKLVSKQKELGWEFIFLGANIDAISTAKQFGLSADDAVDYIADEVGTLKIYSMVDEVVGSIRKEGKRKQNWKAEIEKDYKLRK